MAAPSPLRRLPELAVFTVAAVSVCLCVCFAAKWTSYSHRCVGYSELNPMSPEEWNKDADNTEADEVLGRSKSESVDYKK